MTKKSSLTDTPSGKKWLIEGIFPENIPEDITRSVDDDGKFSMFVWDTLLGIHGDPVVFGPDCNAIFHECSLGNINGLRYLTDNSFVGNLLDESLIVFLSSSRDKDKIYLMTWEKYRDIPSELYLYIVLHLWLPIWYPKIKVPAFSLKYWKINRNKLRKNIYEYFNPSPNSLDFFLSKKKRL